MLNYRKLAAAGFSLAAVGSSGLALADSAPAVAPAGPTLSKILEASGITESAYLDGAYSYANKDSSLDRVFDGQTNSSSLNLHQAAIQIAKQPKEGLGALVNLTLGSDVPVFASYPNNGKSSQFDVTQAYGQYVTGALTVMVGKFATLQGSEVIWAPGNNNFSRSILFGAIPFTHTGARLTYAIDDTTNVIVGINNGWDQVSASTSGKTVELGLTLNPVKPLNITLSDYVGTASAATGGAPSAPGSVPTGARNSLNLVGTYALSDAFTLGLEYLAVSQSNYQGSGVKANYDGVALYATYLFTPSWRLALRGESFNDKDGFHFGTASTKYNEVTATLSYLASDSLEIRGELRSDKASNAVFASNTSKDLATAAVEALFKF